jgi:hypothetical protein
VIWFHDQRQARRGGEENLPVEIGPARRLVEREGVTIPLLFVGQRLEKAERPAGKATLTPTRLDSQMRVRWGPIIASAAARLACCGWHHSAQSTGIMRVPSFDILQCKPMRFEHGVGMADMVNLVVGKDIRGRGPGFRPRAMERLAAPPTTLGDRMMQIETTRFEKPVDRAEIGRMGL